MRSELDVLYSEEQLASAVKRLGEEISRDYRDKDLAIVGVLKGSFIFLADLVRHIEADCTVDFLGVSSYGRRQDMEGIVQITSDLTLPIRNRDVLLIEDIIDTGLTIRYLMDNLATRRPNSMKVCTLLHREDEGECHVNIDYTGFRFRDHYVIGYGMDYAGLHRNIPFIGYKSE